MKAATLIVLLAVVVGSCSGSEDADNDAGTTVGTEAAAKPSGTEAPPVTQLSTEVLEELGSLAPPAAGGESTGPLGSTVIELDTGEGSVQIGGGVVPESLAGLPVPDDLEVQLASETDAAAGFTGVSTKSVVDLAGFFRDSLSSAGYRITSDQSPSTNIVLLAFDGDGGSGDVALSGAPGGSGTTVIVTFTPTG